MVITYDRRGHARSNTPPDNDYSISAQANDAAKIIQHFNQPARVIAHSGGAVIAMELISTHPTLVNQVILYEPPISDCLERDNEFLDALDEIMGFISKDKPTRALNRFWQILGNKDERARVSTPEETRNLKENSQVFIRHEFVSMFYYKPNYKRLKEHLIYIAVGELSEAPHVRLIASLLLRELSCEMIHYPGMHNCAFDLPASFAYMSAGILLMNLQYEVKKQEGFYSVPELL
jgi:pimeloyl-ACP methyl ester carboxylesterase